MELKELLNRFFGILLVLCIMLEIVYIIIDVLPFFIDLYMNDFSFFLFYLILFTALVSIIGFVLTFESTYVHPPLPKRKE